MLGSTTVGMLQRKRYKEAQIAFALQQADARTAGGVAVRGAEGQGVG